MNRSKIEWTDYTWNPVVGCKRGCSYCYARRIHERFNSHPFNEIAVYDERLEQPLKIKKPSKIFVGSMSDIEYWAIPQINNVLEIISKCPWHIFMFLTKGGETYKRFDFSNNCWLGQTVVKKEDYVELPHKNIKFVSFEPLLDNNIGNYRFPADWYIIGGLTPKPRHSKEAIDRILSQAEYFGTPVFIKPNANYPKIIKEYPKLTERVR